MAGALGTATTLAKETVTRWTEDKASALAAALQRARPLLARSPGAHCRGRRGPGLRAAGRGRTAVHAAGRTHRRREREGGHRASSRTCTSSRVGESLRRGRRGSRPSSSRCHGRVRPAPGLDGTPSGRQKPPRPTGSSSSCGCGCSRSHGAGGRVPPAGLARGERGDARRWSGGLGGRLPGGAGWQA